MDVELFTGCLVAVSSTFSHGQGSKRWAGGILCSPNFVDGVTPNIATAFSVRVLRRPHSMWSRIFHARASGTIRRQSHASTTCQLTTTRFQYQSENSLTLN